MQGLKRSRGDPALLGVLIFNGAEPIDLGGTAGVISVANRVIPAVRSIVIARDAGPVRLAGGLTVQADHSVESAPDCDVVIVCGGPGWPKAAKDAALLAYLRRVPAASVCTGSLILAASGKLDGRAATTRRHALGAEAMAPLERLGRSGLIRITEAAVVDDAVVTGGGASLAIDTTLYLLGCLYGTQAAGEIARAIEYDRALAANRDALGWIVPGQGRA